MVRVLTLIIFSMALSNAKCVAGPIELSVPILVPWDRLEKFFLLFRSPAHLALALENSGSRISGDGKVLVEPSGSVRLERDQSFPFKTASLVWLETQGSTHSYRASLELNMGGVSKLVSVPLLINLGHLGRLVLTVPGEFGAVIPSFLIKRANEFFARVLSVDAQKKLLFYLESIEGTSEEALKQKILLDAYNRAPNPTGFIAQPGDAVPVSEQIFLIISLLVWAVGLPAFFIIRWIRSRQKLYREHANS